MRKKILFLLGGAAIGLFLGLSTGVAMQGTAYNGAIVFGPLGALIGWLISGNEIEKMEEPRPTTESESEAIVSFDFEKWATSIFLVMLAIFATVWNFHIDLLKMVRLMPYFREKPWLFFVMALVLSVLFPPFIVPYLVCYFSASHFGLTYENGYRASIRDV